MLYENLVSCLHVHFLLLFTSKKQNKILIFILYDFFLEIPIQKGTHYYIINSGNTGIELLYILQLSTYTTLAYHLTHKQIPMDEVSQNI